MLRTALALVIAISGIGWSAPAAAVSSPLEGIGVVWGKDVGDGTMMIGKRTYHVSPRTAIYGRSGEALEMGEVPVAQNLDGGLKGMKGATVRFEAVELRGQLILYSLELIAAAE